MTERDSRHPAWGDLSLSGVQTLACLRSTQGAPSQGGLSRSTCGCAEHRVLGWAWGCRGDGGSRRWRLVPYQPSWNWGGPTAQVCARAEPATDTNSCRRGAGAGRVPGINQAFRPDMARRGALQAKAPGVHPDEVGGHAPTSAGQSLPAEGGGRVCMRPEPLGAGSTGGATPRMIRGQVWSEVP